MGVDTEQLAVVHCDDTVCAAHKNMVSLRTMLTAFGLLVVALSAIGAAWSHTTGAEVAAMSGRLDRSDYAQDKARDEIRGELKELRRELLSEMRLLRQDLKRTP